MRRANRRLRLVGLTFGLMVGLAGLAAAVDTDGDGVDDANDLCPGSDANTALIDQQGCPLAPACADPWHPVPGADIDADCYVDANDLVILADQWLRCTDPLGPDCLQLQLSPEQMYPDLMYMTQCWPRAVDSLLGDWTDPCWIDLDLNYWSNPVDIVSAKYTPCWDPCNDKIYVAVIVDDTDHVFNASPVAWNSCDRMELYVQADPNGGDNWGYTASQNFDKAQHYSIGYTDILSWTWQVFGVDNYLPGELDLGDTEFEAFSRRTGTTLVYEVGAKAWAWYAGRTPSPSTVPSRVRELEPGIHLGFDVVVGSRWGTEPHDDDEYGMRSANLQTQKHIYADRFQRWELLDYDGTIVPPQCGDWGHLPADIDPTLDCYVNAADFITQALQWMDCTDPDPPCNYSP